MATATAPSDDDHQQQQQQQQRLDNGMHVVLTDIIDEGTNHQHHNNVGMNRNTESTGPTPLSDPEVLSQLWRLSPIPHVQLPFIPAMEMEKMHSFAYHVNNSGGGGASTVGGGASISNNDCLSEEARASLAKYGFVVIENVLRPSEITEAIRAFGRN